MHVVTEFVKDSLVFFDGKYYDIKHSHKLTKEEFAAIQTTFGLKDRSEPVISIKEALEITELAKKITLTASQQKIAQDTSQYLSDLALDMKTQTMNTEHLIFGDQYLTLEQMEMEKKTFKANSQKWQIKELIGSGRDAFAFEAIGVSKNNKDKTVIAKFIKSQPLQVYLNALPVSFPLFIGKINSEQNSVLNLLKQIEQEQIKMNNLAGVKSAQIYANGKQTGTIEEKVPGMTLTSWLQKKPSELKKVYALIELCMQVKLLHKKNLIHGDINPDNILVNDIPGKALELRLIDFGNSRINNSARIRNRVFNINTSDVKVKFSGSKVILKAQFSTEDAKFNEDIEGIRSISRREMHIPEDILARNLSETIDNLVFTYSTSLANVKNLRIPHSDAQTFWQQIEKSNRPELKEIKDLKKQADKITKPKARFKVNKTFIGAVLTTLASAGAMTALYFSKSAVAIGSSLIATVANALIMLSALAFLTFAIVNSFTTGKTINITSWFINPMDDMQRRLSGSKNSKSSEELITDSPIVPKKLSDAFANMTPSASLTPGDGI